MKRMGILILVIFLSSGMAPAQDGPWAPPEPSKAERDWIRLSSGEWLWGTIDLMRDESLYFDSEELDDVTIDWEDIAEIRSARVMTYVMMDQRLVTGTAVLQEDTLRVQTPNGLQEIPKDRVHSIIEGQPNELNYWSAKIGADLKILTGNTSQRDFGLRVFLKREATRSRIDLRFQSNSSLVDHAKTIDNQRSNAEWKVFLSPKFFLTPAKAELYGDKFKNIDYRYSLGVGLGYFLSRGDKADWFVELGAGYKKTRFESVQPGEDVFQENMTLPFRMTLETDLTKDIELTAEYGVQLDLGNEAGDTHHTFVLFEFDLVGDLEFNASFTWDHISRPKENAAGITPKKDDLIMAYGLSLDF